MKTPILATPTSAPRAAASPVASPEPPKVERLNPLPLVLGAAIVGGTLIAGAFALTRNGPKAQEHTTPIEPAPAEPAFLGKPRGDRSADPSLDPSLFSFDERREGEVLAQIEAAHNGAQGSSDDFSDLPYAQSPSYQPAPPPPPDLEGEALTRALRAPVLVPTSLSSEKGTANAPSLLDQLGLPRAPGLTDPPNFEQLARASLEGASASPVARSPQGQALPSLPRQTDAQTTTGAVIPRTPPPSEQDPAQTSDTAGAQRLRAGTVVAAMLLTGIDSSVPGMVVAQVERNVFSEDLRDVVIPRGSRLLGRADQQVALGQRRLLIAWTALLLPDGRTIQLPGLPSHASTGEVGVAGRVQTHALRAFGNAVLLSLVSAGLQIAQPDRSGGVFSAPTPQEITAGAIGQNLAQVATEILRRDLQRAPTIRLEAGTRFVVFLNQDLAIEAGGAR